MEFIDRIIKIMKKIIPRQKNEIHEILEFDAGIMKFMKI